MSSSKPKTAIFLTDPPEVAEKKIKTAKTGGRESLDEQSRMGGAPEECVVYEMLLYHLMPSDQELTELYHACKNGDLMCGECKAKASQLMGQFFQELSKKREKAKYIAERILNKDRK
jgi:tryptophanyl-tRNA synthetase